MRRRCFSTLLALSVALAMILAVTSLSPAAGATGRRITQPVRVTTGDTIPTRTYSSPFLAVDPEDDQTVIASYAEMRTAGCGLARSRDGGRTWARVDASPSPRSHPFCFTPLGANVYFSPAAFGRDHVLYVALAGWDVQDGRSSSVLLARSTDLGDNWTTTVVHDARGKPQPEAEMNRPVSSVVVHTTGSSYVVHVAWTKVLPNARPPGPPAPLVATSADGGRTFSSPVSVAAGYFDDAAVRQAVLANRATVYPPAAPPPPAPETLTADRFGGGGTRITLGDNGTLYALWTPIAAGTFVSPGWWISRSTDQGRTFETSQAVPPTPGVGSPVLAWSRQGGPHGTLHLVYERKVPVEQADRDITYQRSTDGGRSWTEPIVVNDDDPKLLVLQFMPNISVAPDGRVDIAWWDFRDDPGTFRNDVYLASSSDNGSTWSADIRVTDRSIDRKIGPWSNGYDVRQPPGLGPTARYTIVGWDDTRNGDPDAQAQDIYSSFVQFRDLPAHRPAARTYALAAVVGLAFAGLVVSVVAFANRRRARSTAPEASTAISPEPVDAT